MQLIHGTLRHKHCDGMEPVCTVWFQEKSIFTSRKVIRKFIVPFNNMRTLKPNLQLFFAAVSQNYGDSQQTLKNINKLVKNAAQCSHVV